MAIKDISGILLVNGDSIPNELKQLHQWVVWKAELDDSEKYTKVLYQTNGINKASSTDSNTWTTFENALNAYENGVGEGIGFVLTESDPYACIDIDGLEDVNYLPELAEEIVNLSYSEISPSGKGIHVWVKFQHDSQKYKNKNTQLGYEIYSNKRFITFTGEAINELPINEGEEINRFIEKVFKREVSTSTNKLVDQHDNIGKAALSEDQIIKIAEKSKNGDRFKLFMYGGWENRYDSASDADMAFCNDLAFWTNCDYYMMDSIYRKSSIFADRKGSTDPMKWDRQQNSTTYGDETLQKAIRQCTNTFIPKNEKFQIQIKENDSFVFPKGYLSKDGCLYRQVEKIKKDDVEIIEYMICRQTPIITRSFMNVELPQLYHELTWEDDKKLYSETVPAGNLATRKKLLDLADNSLAVADWNVGELIRYFDLLNMVNGKKREHLVERLGHIKKAFIHPLMAKGVTILPPDMGERQQLEAFQVSGTTQEWITNVLEPIKKHPKALLMVLASFTSVLLQDLKLQPFIVDLSGTTSMGKTTVLRAAASVWGTEHLVNEWNITKVAAERKASFLNSFPLILDDTRKADEKQLQSFVYNFSGGRSKGRGSINGSQRELTWGNLLLSTGEASLSTYAESAGGVAARILPITGLPFENVEYEFFEDLYESIEKYYGAIGIEFLQQWGTKRDILLPEAKEYNTLFQKKARGNEVISRIARYYAAIVFTGKLLNIFFNANIDLMVLYKLFDELNEDNKAIDKPMQLLEQILIDLDAKRESIAGKYQVMHNQKAIYKNQTLFLFPAYLKEMLKTEEKTIRSEWLRRGMTLPTVKNGKETDTRLEWHHGKNNRVVPIAPEIVEKLGFDFEEQNTKSY